MWMKKESEMKHVELPEEVGKIVDLSKPSLEALSWLLRHKEMWPRGFEWNYSSCDTCAMGLAYELWTENCVGANTYWMKKIFNLSEEIARAIFIDAVVGQGRLGFSDITPEMIADDIDEYLAGRK